MTELLLWLKSTLVIRALVLYLRLIDSYWSFDCAMLFTCFREPFSVYVREHFTLCLFTAQPGIHLLMLHKSLLVANNKDFWRLPLNFAKEIHRPDRETNSINIVQPRCTMRSKSFHKRHIDCKKNSVIFPAFCKY